MLAGVLEAHPAIIYAQRQRCQIYSKAPSRAATLENQRHEAVFAPEEYPQRSVFCLVKFSQLS
jgi:hypothetical protein